MSQPALLPLTGELKLPYQPRVPQNSVYYRLVEEHFEQLERVWEERYQAGLGYWRSFVSEVIYKYLECGDPHFGFARVKCEECNHEYLLAFSCKCRHFCPACILSPQTAASMIKTALWSDHNLILKRWNRPSGWKFLKCLKKKARSRMQLSTICSAGITAGLISFAADQLTQTIKTDWKGWPNILSGRLSPRKE